MILVTGGTGFIGKYFVSDLIEKGYDVRLLVLGEPPEGLPAKAQVFRGDATRPETLAGIAKDVETVVHMVGVIDLDPKMNFLMNTVATENIVKSCENVEKIVYTSSADAFGPTRGTFDESSVCNPNNPYGKSKIQAEKVIMESGIPNLIFRPVIVYGIGSPWWRHGMNFLRFGFIPDTENFTQVVHVRDVSRALAIGVERGEGTYIIGDESPIRIADLFSHVVRLLGKSPRKIPMWLTSLAATLLREKGYFEVALANREFSVEKAKKELGWKPECNFDLAMKSRVEWYKRMK